MEVETTVIFDLDYDAFRSRLRCVLTSVAVEVETTVIFYLDYGAF